MKMEVLPFDVIAPAGQTLGESASWCARTHMLWWIDIRAPLGEFDRLVRPPVSSQPTSCSFGGPDPDPPFVTSATQRLPPEALAAEPLAGAVLALRLGVQGLAEPAFLSHGLKPKLPASPIPFTTPLETP